MTREGLETWYDGYYAKNGERMYNPRSVVASLTNNNLDSYWTSSGPYDEIFYYVKNNVAEVRSYVYESDNQRGNFVSNGSVWFPELLSGKSLYSE